MKTVVLALILGCCLAGHAANSGTTAPMILKSPKAEIAELEAQIAAAKDSGIPTDPAWSARIRELLPLVKGHPGKLVEGLPTARVDRGFAEGAVMRSQQLTPLETQIKEFEFQIDGGASAVEPDPATVANLKDQLNELYAQRSENRERNPLDQGADACPATVLTGNFFEDSGTTSGRANNYNPLIPCGASTAPDVIYQWSPPYTSIFTISTDGSSYDTYLHIRWLGACPGTTQYACDDDGGIGTSSSITMRFYSFETYYIIVDGFSSNSGAYNLTCIEDCDIALPSCDITECAENVFNPFHSVNDCNGACNNENLIPTWQNIDLCQTVCGRMFTYVNHNSQNWRDTDSYRFTLTEACTLRISLETESRTQLFIFNDGCPWSTTLFAATWLYPCSTVTYTTGCIPAGTYSFWIGPSFFSGMDSLADYRFRLDPRPCSGCRIDGDINAPGSSGWHTCNAGNDNTLRPSQDYTFCVNIPFEGDWTFSTCNDDSIWDSYIYLTTQCNGGVIASDDDGCGGVGLSVISCVHLLAGTYYLTVEGFSSTNCGPFTLNVTECLGACCLAGQPNPVCEYVSAATCAEFGGVFTINEQCNPGSCYIRPECAPNALFTQLPELPYESWNGFGSDTEFPSALPDNFDLPLGSPPIGSLRFWGFPLNCGAELDSFEIQISDGIADTCFYFVTALGTPVPYLYNVYTMYEYSVTLDPPCNIDSGTVQIVQVSAGCLWYWASTGNGDGVWPSGYDDFAFCLGGSCSQIDSLAIFRQGEDDYMLHWWQAQDGLVQLYTATDPNAVWPAGFTLYGSLYAAAGRQSGNYFESAPYNNAVLVLDCGFIPAGVALHGPRAFRKLETTK